MLPKLTLDFKLHINSMPGSFLVLLPNTPEYTILAVSDELLQNTSKTRDNVVGKGLFEVYPENPEAVTATGPSNVRISLQNVITHKTLDQMPIVRYDVPDASGKFETRYWSANSSPIFDEAGELLYILHQTQDITEQIVAENKQAALRNLEEKYSLFMHAPMAVCVLTGPENIIELINEQMLAFYGIATNVVGKPLFEVIPEAKGQGFAEMLDKVRKTGIKYSVTEYPTKATKNGEVMLYYYNIVCQPYYKNTTGTSPLGVFCMAHDVTQQVLDKQKVEESENRLQAIIEATPECIKIVSPDGKLNYMNPWGLNIIEGDSSLLGNANIIDIIAPAYRATWLENHERVCNGESLSWEYEIIGLKGGRRRMESHAVPLATPAGKMHLAVARDITAKKTSELALILSEDKFRVFANNIQNLAWMAEPDGWITWYNERWFEYTGTTLEDMLGWGWEKVHHPDHVERVISFVQKVWVKWETWELSFPLRRADGKYRWFLTRAHAVKDVQGKVIRWIGTNTDIDEQKQAEVALENKNRELTRINNDLDNFIYTASHDLKAPISNIEGLLEILAAEIAEAEPGKEDAGYILDLMRSSIERFTKTIDNLTDLVKLQQENTALSTKVNLNTLIEDVKLDLKPLILKTGAVLEVDVENCPEINFSEKNLRSVFQNLISNALKYHSPDRIPVIKITCTTLADHNILTVEDNGLGISQKNLEQMFTMFKRFHDHVDGTGIGLYMIKKMVEIAGGTITVESQLGVGTKFKVYFRKQ